MTKIRAAYKPGDVAQLRQSIDDLNGFQEDGVLYLRSSCSYELVSELLLGHPGGFHLTVDGTTAPGPVEIVGHTTRINRSNVTLRGITFRDPGKNHPNPDNTDAFGIGTTSVIENVLIENCAFMHSIDGNMDLFFSGAGRGNDIELRYNIFAECFDEAGHSNGRHSTNCLLAPNDPTGGRVRIHHNLFASSISRNPNVSGGGQIYVYNNLSFNCARGNEFRTDGAGNPTIGAAVGNHYIPGVNCAFDDNDKRIHMGQIWNVAAGSQVFIRGNLCDTREGGYDLFDDWKFQPARGEAGDASQFLTGTWPLDYGSPDDADPVETVYANVLANAGPINRKGTAITRHPHVERVLREVLDGTSRVPKDRSEIPVMVLPTTLSGDAANPDDRALFALDQQAARSISGKTDLEMYLRETALGLY